MTAELCALLERLDEAFSDAPAPTAGGIVTDNSGYHLECNQIISKFHGRHWRNLSIEDLEGEADSLAFFTPEAFRFLLPAFIRVALTDPERADRIPDAILWSLAQPNDQEFWETRKDSMLEVFRARGIPEKLLLDLAPREEPQVDAACRKRVDVLTDSQKCAVIDFVHFLKKYRGEEFTFGELDQVEEALRS